MIQKPGMFNDPEIRFILVSTLLGAAAVALMVDGYLFLTIIF